MHGLSQSRFGIVIFSDAYLRKKWTQRELAGLLQLAEDGRHTLLPILHNISLTVIEEQYPALADAVFGSTQGGIDELATEIARVLDMPEYGSPSTISPGVRRRFAALLERQPSTDEIVSFLRLSPQILSARLGIIAPDISAEKEAERD